mgnify:CR=1 FL=1|jgi:protein-tyrosine phosphatase
MEKAGLRHLPLHSTCNTRDLGGYQTASGHITRWGWLFRSDMPHGLDDADRAALQKLGLCTVIDLRSVEQVQTQPSEFASLHGVEYWSCSFASGNRDPDTLADMPQVTMEMLDDRSNIARVMRLILRSAGPVLFHCAAGKDRTGIIAALLLREAGVSQADVIADYSLSYAYVMPVVRMLRKELPGNPDWYGRSDPEVMEEVLRQVGDVDAYLEGCGLSAEERAGLRRCLCPEELF